MDEKKKKFGYQSEIKRFININPREMNKFEYLKNLKPEWFYLDWILSITLIKIGRQFNSSKTYIHERTNKINKRMQNNYKIMACLN